MNNSEINEGKTYAIIAYLTLFGTLIAFFMNRDRKNEFTLFHVRQALGLGVLFFIIGNMISGFNNLNISIAFWVVFLGLYILGLSGAVSGKYLSIPFLGPLFQKIFKSMR